MTREQKEAALFEALNKATDTSRGFFIQHLGMYAVESGRIRDLVMAMGAEDFELFYSDEIDNLKADLPHE